VLVTVEAVGFVYLLTNASMPGLVKVGRTTRILSTRAEELRGTGVPTPFEIAGYFVTSTPAADELSLHCRLAAHREAPDREFFRIGVDEALRIAEQLLGPASQRRSPTPPVSYEQVADGSITTSARFVVDPGGNVLDQRVFLEPVPDENE
jgi:hypothetical protein